MVASSSAQICSIRSTSYQALYLGASAIHTRSGGSYHADIGALAVKQVPEVCDLCVTPSVRRPGTTSTYLHPQASDLRPPWSACISDISSLYASAAASAPRST
jgi:hypothetical protein